ncbi:MAG: isochorismatase family protein [Bacilli bacterium]
MNFRQLQESDYISVISVMDNWWDGRHMADMLPKLFFQHFQDTSFVVEENGQLVAFLVGFVSQTDADEAYIHFVGVHPEYRRHELARRLYDRFFTVVQDRGCQRVRCVTSPVNKGSILFHTRMGFRMEAGNGEVDGVPVFTDHDGAGHSRVRFVRNLRPELNSGPATDSTANTAHTAHTALLVIDVQVGMFAPHNPVFQGAILLREMRTLISRARQAGAPIFYIRHDGGDESDLAYGSPAWHLHSDMARTDADIVIDKRTPDSFFETPLQNLLQQRGIRNLVMCGIQTEVCVDTTCRRAFSLGYRVTLASDAHSTWPRGELSAQQIIAHHNDVLRWFADAAPVESIGLGALSGEYTL